MLVSLVMVLIKNGPWRFGQFYAHFYEAGHVEIRDMSAEKIDTGDIKDLTKRGF